MTDVKFRHMQAMDCAKASLMFRDRGDYENAEHFAMMGYRFECDALEIVRGLPGNEPTWSILCISAASLAAHAGLYDDAERWIAEGLAGDPPPKQQRDLHEIAEWIANLRSAAA